MRNAFAKYPQLLDTLVANPIFGRTFITLVSEGCASGELIWLLNVLVNRDGAASRYKKDLDFLKSRLHGVIRGLESLREDVVSLSKSQIGGDPLADRISFDDIDLRVESKFARKYLSIDLPGELAWAKAYFRELKEKLAEELSVRKFAASARLFAWLYAYSCAGTGRPVTYREVSDLVNAGFVANGRSSDVSEAVVRMNLQRFKRSSALAYEHLTLLMKDYVSSCPTGHPTIADWVSSNFDSWASANVQPMAPVQVTLEIERRAKKFTEHERKFAEHERAKK